MQILTLDVSQLSPPEPMREICAKLPELQSGQLLHVFHRREPVPLYELLAQQGLNYLHLQQEHGKHHIWIWHKDDQITEQRANEQFHALNRS